MTQVDVPTFQTIPLARIAVPRVDWLDTLKGLAIVFVVVGHVTGGLRGAHLMNGPRVDYAYRWIYAFHMATFFFASGVFAVRRDVPSLSAFFVDRLKTLAWPYLVWSLVFMAMTASMAMVGAINTVDARFRPWTIIYQPVGVQWFLYVLFIFHLIAGLIVWKKWNRLAIAPIAIAVAIFVAHEWVVTHPSIAEHVWDVLLSTAQFLPFFTAGFCLRERVMAWNIRCVASIALIVGMVVGFSVLSVGVYKNLDQMPWVWPITAMAGIVGLSALAISMERLRIASVFRTWGAQSVAIFLLHPFASVPVRIVLVRAHVYAWPIHLLLGTAVGVLGSVAVYRLCTRLGLYYLFTLRRQGSNILPKAA